MTSPDPAPVWTTAGGVRVTRTSVEEDATEAVERLVDALDGRRGMLLTSGFEYPGRYTRWDLGYVDPPLEVTARGREVQVRALNERGRVLLPAVRAALAAELDATGLEASEHHLRGVVPPGPATFAEEERSRQPTVFSAVRALLELFASPSDPHLGLYGAFGYDLVFQFEPIELRKERSDAQRVLVLHLPDELLVVDRHRETAYRHRYDFAVGGTSTRGLPRGGPVTRYRATRRVARRDHRPGEYAALVRVAQAAFRRGDLFEVVPSQTFSEPCPAPPSAVFRRLRRRNPSPYGFLANLGEQEYLIGASPEMYMRVDGDRVETCPISGTIARGSNPIEDAAQIRALLNSTKDEAELTMCTDVDRNDKARICEPGSVRVIGRRQIELYSRVIHTVDHVEGRLRPGYTGLDAFLSHAWAVTVTGAPKRWAIRFIEEHEATPRAWYGGSVGLLGFDGRVNTGLTLRTIHVRDGMAHVRVGATLLHDSDPEAEERETELKADALLDALRRPSPERVPRPAAIPAAVSARTPNGPRVLLIDHEDSFVHILADYFRQAGATVVTRRSGFPVELLDRERPDLIVLSPGPGRPADFNVADELAAAEARGLPVFGVCLGLQGMAEYAGSRLGILAEPMHGKASRVRVLGGRLLAGLPDALVVGRYHSLFAVRASLPPDLEVTAVDDDGVVMALEHRRLPFAAVQFHPESIMSAHGDTGLRIVGNALAMLVLDRDERTEAAACGAPALLVAGAEGSER